MVQFDDDDESFELNNDSSSDNENLQTEVRMCHLCSFSLR